MMVEKTKARSLLTRYELFFIAVYLLLLNLYARHLLESHNQKLEMDEEYWNRIVTFHESVLGVSVESLKLMVISIFVFLIFIGIYLLNKKGKRVIGYTLFVVPSILVLSYMKFLITL